MIKRIIRKFIKPKLPKDNESLIRIIQLIKEDSTVRNDILNILNMESSKRNYALSQVAMIMRQNKEPEEIIIAILSLKDDGMAKKIYEYLGS